MSAPRFDSFRSWRRLLLRGSVYGFVCLFGVGLLAGCDLLGIGNARQCTLPGTKLQTNGRMVLTAVFEDTLEGEVDPNRRLVVTDFWNPSDYRVLQKAGDHVGQAYLGPEKRRIVFEDDVNLIEDAGGRLKLYDLESDEVRALPDAPWTSMTGEVIVWSTDGSGFYYNASGKTGTVPPLVYYDLDKQEARFVAQKTRLHGLKGHTSILVNSRESPNDEKRFPFYFFDIATEEYVEHVRNEYLKFVEWEDESRGGHKYAAFGPAYGKETNLIAFRQKSNDETRLAITDVEGDCFGTYTDGRYVDSDLDWGPGGTVLFGRHDSFGSGWSTYRVMVLNPETGKVRRLVDPEVVDGAIGLHSPNY